MTLFQLATATTAPPEWAPMWELAKGVLLTLGTTAAISALRIMIAVRDEVREIKQELFGRDGTNGMRSVVKKNAERLDAIDARHIAMDAVAAAEQDLHDGDERRHRARRLSDTIREKHS